MPQRIQRRRVKGWRRGDAVIVDRTSRYGNPFTIEDFGSAEAAVDAFERHLRARREAPTGWVDLIGYPSDADIRRDLAGRDLACPCALPAPGEIDWCHARILIELSNRED